LLASEDTHFSASFERCREALNRSKQINKVE